MRSFEYQGVEYFTGVAVGHAKCSRCDGPVQAGVEAYVSAAGSGLQSVVDRWCGLDITLDKLVES